MEKLSETQKFPTYKKTDDFEEWMTSFQTWIENKIYAELAGKVNFLLGNTCLPDIAEYADNDAAIAGGLVAGDFYRNGGDPDIVCIVQ